MFSIGCIFYKLLTGRVPFNGTRAEVIKVQKRKISALEFNPPISKKNLQLIKRCLKPISFQRFSIAKTIEEKTFLINYQQGFTKFIQSQKVLEYLTKVDFLKTYKDKQDDVDDFQSFLMALFDDMHGNIAINLDEKSFCVTFTYQIRVNTSLLGLPDEITLSEFLELVF